MTARSATHAGVSGARDRRAEPELAELLGEVGKITVERRLLLAQLRQACAVGNHTLVFELASKLVGLTE